MKGSRLLLIFIFIITAVLGGTAIWIGWRLSKEKEIAPEESEAWTSCPDYGEHRGDGLCEPAVDCMLIHNNTDCSNIPMSSGRVSKDVNDYISCCNNDCAGYSLEVWEFICRGPMTDEICEVCYTGSCGSEDCYDRDSEGNCVNERCDCSSCANQTPSTDTPCHCCYSYSTQTWYHDRLGECVDEGPGYNSHGYSPQPPNTFEGDYSCRNVQIDIWQSVDSFGTLVFKCQMDPDGVWGPPNENPGWDFYNCAQEYNCGDTGCGSEGDICDDGTTCHNNGETMTCCNQCSGGTWECNASTNCECPGDLSCDNLVASRTTIPENGGNIFLTTTAGATNIQITGYTYGSDIGTITESSPLSTSETSTADWTIPSGLTGGDEYNAWVTISGAGVDDVGCSGVGECTSGDEECEITIQVQEGDSPYFDAQKESSVVCINNNTAARITYTITVTNISDVSGRVLSIVDTYDSRFQSSWISSITPTPDSHTGNIITWNNDGAGWELGPGESLTSFNYIVTVPSEYFGTYENGVFVPYQYRNFAIVHTEDEDFELETELEIVCQVSTGIFDTAVNAGMVALLLIILGFVGLRYQQSIEILIYRSSRKWPIKVIAERVVYSRKKEKFERESLKKTDNKRGNKR